LEHGRTPVLDGFVSKAGKPFKAALVLQNGKVQYEFTDNYDKGKEHRRIRIRLQSNQFGSVTLSIPDRNDIGINYGLVSSRMAERLGAITALNLLKHEQERPMITLSLNNLEFTRYPLRERTRNAAGARIPLGASEGLSELGSQTGTSQKIPFTICRRECF